jgi:hypothetical protein
MGRPRLLAHGCSYDSSQPAMPKSTKAAPKHSNESATILVAAIHELRLIVSVVMIGPQRSQPTAS